MTTTTKPLTLTEFLKLPETKPAREFINGQIYQKPMPQGKHSTLQIRLTDTINEAGFQKKIAYAFPELRCTFGGRSIVPDVAVFQWDKIPFDADGEVANVFERSPDWTIEILSPDQSQTKVIDNILFCLRHQTSLGWLIDPDEKAVLCFQPNQLPEIKRQLEDSLPVPDFLDLRLTVGQVFSWLKLGQRF
ncbi:MULTISPECIES: Uma2 family endonuclease [unclassified Coleofasciculus]|uniref:Uma2 family endonuclease n=1 Tax=unclassified Coleofasciculus TaxID=2692782 RepID=UPI00187FA712|nr:MULTISPECIES: Uma2 family endonuclease [unclassified Coleofasciculus]MBE9126000.1 Uma2 family endonuclease [Coleofasciculus sp. LEGE 07081]MBE9149375.1 Uma2 family endonuclease [Coleofasciculus sp. LEGE 07092]